MDEIDMLGRVALTYTGNPVDAEDLVQDTLVLALRFHDAFKKGTNLKKLLRSRRR